MTYAFDLGVVLPGSDYPSTISVSPPDFPYPDGLVASFTFGGGDLWGTFNHADADEPATLYGDPATDAAFGVTTSAGSGWYDCGRVPTSGMTVIFVAKPRLSGSSFVLGNYDTATLDGDFFGFNNGLRASDAPELSVAGLDGDTWYVCAGRIKATGESRSYVYAEGHVNAGTESAPAARTPVVSRTMLIGRLPAAGVTGAQALASVAVWNVALSDADLDANMTWLNDVWLPRFGVPAQ